MHRLKIVEQIIIVLVAAVLIPFFTIGVIISNISQHSIRSELAHSASLMANFLADTIENYVLYSELQLNQTASSFKYIQDHVAQLSYLSDIETNTKLFKSLKIIEKNEIPPEKYEVSEGRLTLVSPIDLNRYLSSQINLDIFELLLGQKNTQDRNIYIFDSKTRDLILTNAPKSTVREVLSGLDTDSAIDTIIFGNKKNTPKAYHKIKNPDWFVVVDTTKQVTKNTITRARVDIILALSIAAFSIILVVGLYTSYLYINIRQLFKGIKAVSKGNYDKKIHLIKRAFTPHEIVFLAKEFNYMANKINLSHRDLRAKNEQLEKLNEFRENLINATSHEFRTPLTSIIGYTSRLLRHDIKLDDETRTKSLQIVKSQAQRLSRMVEDLLVIPELDSFSLKFNIDTVDITSELMLALDYLKSEEIDFDIDIAQNLSPVWADEYRLGQIFVNLIDNAMKYSKNKAPVKIKAYMEGDTPIVKIINECDKIDEDVKTKLFDKFIRADSKLTRTTRGTGLGLYIVKGLCSAMKIDINLDADEEFIMTLKFSDTAL